MADIVYPGSKAGGPINSGAMPGNYDLSIYEGDSCKFTVTVRDSAGVAVNLTGYTADAALKKSYSDTTQINFDCTIDAPETGVVTLRLSPAVTAELDTDSGYIWDFQLTEPSGDIRTYLAGDVTVLPEVTA